MTLDELEASRAHEETAKKAAKAAPKPRELVRIHSPWYDPEKTPRPRLLDGVFATYS
jgi:hypothetical protein